MISGLPLDMVDSPTGAGQITPRGARLVAKPNVFTSVFFIMLSDVEAAYVLYIYIFIWGHALHNFIASVIVVLRAALARPPHAVQD